MEVLYLGSNEKKTAGKEEGQDWSKILWNEIEMNSLNINC